ncbi:MAG: glutathione-regulated potassium-efflux system protein KefB [Nevskiaceae bacterium]|nr:MAG: glutathione-regulated potassium-efflux system protein KefB [Nevskiaceae bacterium]TBR75086.1 MAG: glutathione-regulated potassium-efflux system protein KefB [Nevskiaceae bacterium]
MLADIVLFLGAAVIAVPIFRRLKLGAVLGYLAAGVAIGPSGLGFVTDIDRILQVSELGVVMLLFVIGLELQVSRLRALRTTVFGLGTAQIVLTTAALATLAWLSGWKLTVALTIGFGLALSSTAFVIQMLSERGELVTRHGRASFGILLFQDIAVIPFIAILPMLAGHHIHPSASAIAATLLTLLLVVVVARYLLRPVLRLLASTQVPEIFTAAALLLVIGTAMAMESVGLSASLGAFVAGVLLADSEYRHALQADIEPFKGLLLGLFFIAVGMSADFSLVVERPLDVIIVVATLMGVKALVLFGIGRFAKLPAGSALSLAASLSQGGEFAFVLFSLAARAGLLPLQVQSLLVVAVTLSMVATPLLYAMIARLRRVDDAPPFDEVDVPPSPVVIVGFGPFGQIIGRMLRVKKIPYTVLEKNWQQVDFVRRFGSRVFYSDASRPEVLRAAQVDKARLLIITIPDEENSLRIARLVRGEYPKLRIFAVARTRMHQMRLMDLGISDVIRRSYFSSLEMTADILVALGASQEQARADITLFRQHDESTLARQHAVYRDERKLVQTAREAAEELEQLFETDRVTRNGQP